eukprot:TRINITY_DN727_c0_g1_i2.p1 TRINITY_DN727_c0_g1~~TRINITY_DN727_c0_g1_i2.p1  ORF type:complete len:532 (+),score=113.39 TRINITY_DN727_c0_g1_i2:512-2107(+)
MRWPSLSARSARRRRRGCGRSSRRRRSRPSPSCRRRSQTWRRSSGARSNPSSRLEQSIIEAEVRAESSKVGERRRTEELVCNAISGGEASARMIITALEDAQRGVLSSLRQVDESERRKQEQQVAKLRAQLTGDQAAAADRDREAAKKEADVASMQARIGDLESAVAGSETVTSELRQQVTELQEQLERAKQERAEMERNKEAVALAVGKECEVEVEKIRAELEKEKEQALALLQKEKSNLEEELRRKEQSIIEAEVRAESSKMGESRKAALAAMQHLVELEAHTRQQVTVLAAEAWSVLEDLQNQHRHGVHQLLQVKQDLEARSAAWQEEREKMEQSKEQTNAAVGQECAAEVEKIRAELQKEKEQALALLQKEKSNLEEELRRKEQSIIEAEVRAESSKMGESRKAALAAMQHLVELEAHTRQQVTVLAAEAWSVLEDLQNQHRHGVHQLLQVKQDLEARSAAWQEEREKNGAEQRANECGCRARVRSRGGKDSRGASEGEGAGPRPPAEGEVKPGGGAPAQGAIHHRG